MTAKLRTEKIDYLIDEDINIVIEKCKPNSKIVLVAEMTDDEGKTFQSEATFMSNKHGEVNLAKEIPLNGTYESLDPSGLFWSMRLKDSKEEDYFEKNNDEPVQVTLKALVNNKTVSEKLINLRFKDESVSREEITHDKIKGALYRPNNERMYPAVILLNGSDGGYKANSAAFLASKGYIVLALSYFNSEGTSKELENIQLEYFKIASDWLKELPRSKPIVHLIGYSKGAELALLLGATFNGYSSIIAGAPGAYITSGMRDGVFAPVDGWTLNGSALPYLKNKYPLKMMVTYIINSIRKTPMSFLSIWEKTLKMSKNKDDYQIDTNRIECPILLISGENDELWPSSDFSRRIEASRKHEQDKFLYYDKGGHFLSFPYAFKHLPANTHVKINKMTMKFGGEKQVNAYAAENTLATILKFLDENSR